MGFEVPPPVGRARSHFLRRALERHGLKLTYRDYQIVIDALANREGEFIKWAEGDLYRAFYKISIYGNPYLVLFDFTLNALITILHNSWMKLENGKWVEPVKTSAKRKRWINYFYRMRRKNVEL